MRWSVRDPLLYARAVAIGGISVFVATGGGVVAPLVPISIAWIVASMAHPA